MVLDEFAAAIVCHTQPKECFGPVWGAKEAAEAAEAAKALPSHLFTIPNIHFLVVLCCVLLFFLFSEHISCYSERGGQDGGETVVVTQCQSEMITNGKREMMIHRTRRQFTQSSSARRGVQNQRDENGAGRNGGGGRGGGVGGR